MGKSIVLETLKLTIQRKNWVWMGGVPGVVTILSYAMQIVKLEWWIVAIMFVIGIFTIGVLLFLRFLVPAIILRHHELKVDSNWGETVKDLALAYAVIHELERNSKTITSRDIATALSKFCDVVKSIFDRLSDSNCCVSIKVPVSNYLESGEWNSIHVKNVARDKRHILERDTDEYKATNHDILGNTAYSRVISLVLKESSKPHVYLNNDVDPLKDPNYATTSPENNERKAIPYKSELVVPIVPTKYGKLSEVMFGGFLCIDSDKRDAFDAEHYDVPMTQGLADGLYILMLRLLELQTTNN